MVSAGIEIPVVTISVLSVCGSIVIDSIVLIASVVLDVGLPGNFSLQETPAHGSKQWHLPTLLHKPCPEQLLGHWVVFFRSTSKDMHLRFKQSFSSPHLVPSSVIAASGTSRPIFKLVPLQVIVSLPKGQNELNTSRWIPITGRLPVARHHSLPHFASWSLHGRYFPLLVFRQWPNLSARVLWYR